MALSDVRSTRNWQNAIDLAPMLVRLAEELPAAEQMGLSLQLRQAMVEVPATIAADTLSSGDGSPKLAVLRLVAVLELIEKVYPALDTASVRSAVDSLAERLTSGDQSQASLKAGEQPQSSVDEPVSQPVQASSGPVGDAASVPAADELSLVPEAPSAAPAPVAVVPQPVSPPSPSKIEVTPDGAVVPAADQQEDHVQPDSIKQAS